MKPVAHPDRAKKNNGGTIDPFENPAGRPVLDHHIVRFIELFIKAQHHLAHIVHTCAQAPLAGYQLAKLLVNVATQPSTNAGHLRTVPSAAVKFSVKPLASMLTKVPRNADTS